jgi:hypothetical protein
MNHSPIGPPSTFSSDGPNSSGKSFIAFIMFERTQVVCILLANSSMELELVVHRIREEFLEMPGLRLTPAQATRLWGLERETCQAVINSLVASAFLRWTAAGAVTRAEH